MTSTDPSASSRLERTLAAIAAHDGAIRAFCDLRVDAARAEAAALDRLPASQRGPLHGVPVAVKEIFDVAGCRCAWGTPIHAQRRPTADCEAVARLKAAGAVVVGTTTSTEYAMGRETGTGNPYALGRSPGASSSGSAAAVAAGLVDLALGSQTIGSGIRPAGYCGVAGLKPTHGAIPMSGVMPLSPPLDHAAILGRDLDLVAAAFGVLGGRAFDAVAGGGPAALRLGLVASWFADAVDERVWTLVQAAAHRVAGGAAEDIAVPDAVKQAEQGCVETLLSADLWRHHAADEQAAGNLMSPALKAWLARGRQVDEPAYRRELARREQIIGAMDAAVGAVGIVATLATVGVAPPRSEGSGSRAPQRLWNLLGWPALAVPVGMVDGLPVAVQLVARPGEEGRLLSAGRRFAAQFEVPRPAPAASA